MKITVVSVTLILALLLPALAFAEGGASPGPYDGADPATKQKLAACDELVAQRKYLSAYNSLGPAAGDDEYLIATRIELCLDYFVLSMNHGMFAFTDLKPGEDLMALRKDSSGRKYSMVMYDPVKVVDEYYKAKPRSALLEKSLGDYFYEVRLRYGGRWTESDEAISGKAVSHYETAFAMGLEDASSLSNCAESHLQLGAFDKAASCYEKYFALGMDSGNARFNAAFAYIRLGDSDRALAEATKAIALYADNPDYRYDAFLLAGDASRNKGDLDGAVSLFAEAQKIEARDYRLYNKRLYTYLVKGDPAAALGDASSLFGFAPRNPAATQLVMDAYADSGKSAWLPAFFEWGIGAFVADPEALGNLLFHYSMWAHDAKDDAKARGLLDRAEEAFKKSGTTNSQVFEAIAAQREVYGK
jgi:tetratricopeptide (TPR) repeat protein